MLTLKITPGTAQFCPFHILVPSHISFYQLHATLELLLHPIPLTYYSFMLMTNHCAIEAQEAGNFRIVPAFEKNSLIQYRNPYPGEALCTLELESVDTPGDSLYPIVKGTEGDGECNARLQEYCTFTESWSYQNMIYFKKRQEEQQRQATNIKRQPQQRRPLKEKSSQLSAPSILWRPKNPGERLSFLFYLTDMYDEVRISVDVSEYGQAELLGQVKKENLLRYCRYAGFRTKSIWRKAQIAECFCRNLQENIWLCLILLPREALELYLRLCRMKKGRKISVDAEDVDLLRLFLELGIADMAYPDQKNVLIFELAEDFRQSFLQVFQSTYRFDRDSPASVYLSPEKKTGSWQKLADGYGLLDERVGMLLRYYGLLTEEQLCTYLKTCYGYSFTSAEFSRYLMLRLRLLELVYTGVNQELKKRIVCLNGLDVERAYRAQRRFHMPADEWKPVNQKALEENEEILSEWYHFFTALIEPYVGETQTGFLIAQQLAKMVAGNVGWEYFFSVLEELLDDLEEQELLMFWYQLSRFYLKLPVAALGGYSRVEYAEKHSLENPYEILYDSDWEDEEDIFYMPLDVQWELFRLCDRFMEDGNDLAGRQLIKYARKLFGKELAEYLHLYCCLLSGNPRFITLLKEKAEKGDEDAIEMLEEMKSFLNSMFD